MQCPTCKIEGHRSTVTGGVGIETMMYSPPFFDEDGKEHHHDSNVTTVNYKCSRGHKFTQSSGHRCWCGWTVNGMLAVD